MATKTISMAEVAKHKQPGDVWFVIDGDVYDVSKFGKMHPGGSKVLEQVAGRDVTVDFYELHRKDVLKKYQRLIVGRLDSAGPKPAVEVGELSKVPFEEIPAFQGQYSPYFNDTHTKFLKACRKFVQEELVPIASTQDLSGEYPSRELQSKLGLNGMLVTRMGPGPWLKEAIEAGVKIPGDVKPEEFDYFHEMIAHQEIARLGLPGFVDGLGMGWLISAPAVYHFGSPEMRKTVFRELVRGDKWSVLSISEPYAGSDVAGIRATAEKSADGQYYIVNGVKKWITEGVYADYFVTPVRTGAAGQKGISLLLIERGEGMITTQIKTTYSTAAGTALVIMEDMKVPVKNLMGKENDGFKLIMYNFNHERWLMLNSLLGQMRAALADTFMWTRQRKVFGKPLIEQAVVRNKLASAVAAMESCQSWNEALTYDMCRHPEGPLGQRLGGPIAMLKYQVTRAAWKVADDAVQILGGRGITRTGMGMKIEGLKNYAKYCAVYGGSEEVLADLSVKQALRSFPPASKL